MSSPRFSRRPTTTVVLQSLLWFWLICLSIFVLLGHQAMSDQSDQEQLDTRLHRIEAQATGLAETIQDLQQRPAAATATDLQTLEARIAQVEQTQSRHATADDLQMLRVDIDQIKAAQQAAAHAAVPAKPRASNKPVSTKPASTAMPFRVVGVELRAGLRSVSVAPSGGSYTPDQLQVLLPGDTVGPWRLQSIEGNTAVFQVGNQTRRLAIP
jgi:hypothetical protein